MKKTLKGKTVVVIGRASGIGLKIAMDFVSKGAFVYILDKNRKALDRINAHIIDDFAGMGFDIPKIGLVHIKTRNINQLKKFFESLDPRVNIDILVNNLSLGLKHKLINSLFLK